MTPTTRFLLGRKSDGSILWAGVDENAHHLEGQVRDRRFGAYCCPYQCEEAARAALIAAGALDVKPEVRKRAK